MIEVRRSPFDDELIRITLKSCGSSDLFTKPIWGEQSRIMSFWCDSHGLRKSLNIAKFKIKIYQHCREHISCWHAGGKKTKISF